MSIEIDQLNSRLVEAETKLKTEVQRIRKKLQITITELELTLDVANKNNIELQKSLKKQSLQLTVNWDSTPISLRFLFLIMLITILITILGTSIDVRRNTTSAANHC
jgi:hypothetical protein